MAMSSEENLQAVRSIYDTFARGDTETAASFFDSMIALREPESLPYGGIHKGFEGPNASLK
jgi:hypothetical protein